MFRRWKEPEFPSYFAPVLPFKQSLGHSPTQGGEVGGGQQWRKTQFIKPFAEIHAGGLL